MNNFVRICLVVMAVGVVCCIGGAAAGGRLYSSVRGSTLFPMSWGGLPRLHPIEEEEQAAGSGRHGIQNPVWEPAEPKAPASRPEAPEAPDTPETGGTLPELERVTTLKKMDFELGAGDYTIVVGDDYGLEYDGSWISSDMDNGVWKLRTDFHWSNFGIGTPRSCTIIVPAGCTVEEIDWSVGAANVWVEAPITAEEVDIELGAGNLTIDSLDVTKELSADIGAGNLELVLTGREADYDIRADVAMGTVNVNGQELVSGFVGSAGLRGEGTRKIRFDVGVGNVDLETAQ